MKKLLILATILPSVSFASLYSCSGAGFNLEVAANPLSMRVVGNGYNTNLTNLNAVVNFDTIVSGNTANPPGTFKLVVKDSSFANPGDQFKGIVTVSTPTGVREFPGLTCVKGND